MTLAEILEGYIKIKTLKNGFEIYVVKPKWISPHETETEWVLAYKKEYEAVELRIKNMPVVSLGGRSYGFERCGISDPDICYGLEKVLDRKAFFKTCDDCGVRSHTFHMEGRICNSCIPEVPGLVY